ncbi:unnamed protein product [Closterium sp. NIES-64]|nr:unnamed protein product [Closterium sp. NIES-64]
MVESLASPLIGPCSSDAVSSKGKASRCRAQPAMGSQLSGEKERLTQGAPLSHEDSAHEQFEKSHGPHGQKLTLLPLIALIFFEVSGGPYGVEDAVKYGGPLLAILGFTVFPLIWSVPEALTTAELGTAFPENGGYVVWVSAAFGPFWGFQEGWWKWLSGVIDNSLYPLLFLDYLKRELPVFGGGLPRMAALLAMTLVLTYVNYRGLTIVGATAIALAVFGLLPFVVMALLAIPKIQPARWLVVDLNRVQWRGYFNTLFWNLNYWDSVSTLAGEIEEPKRTFPRALMGAVVLVVVSYLVPLLAGTGAVPFSPDGWDDGYLAVVGRVIGGGWLAWWIACAAALSNMGAFEAEMSSDAFQLLGMAERGLLPEVFTYRSRHGTPVLGIVCSATGIVLLSWMSFQEIVEFLNFLYCFGMLLEFAAFVALRVTQPDLNRPYRVPVDTMGAALLCLPPSLLLVLVMALASWQTVIVRCEVCYESNRNAHGSSTLLVMALASWQAVIVSSIAALLGLLLPLLMMGPSIRKSYPPLLAYSSMHLAAPLPHRPASSIAAVVGLLMYPLLMWAKHHGVLKFTQDPGLPDVALMDEDDGSEGEGGFDGAAGKGGMGKEDGGAGVQDWVDGDGAVADSENGLLLGKEGREKGSSKVVPAECPGKSDGSLRAGAGDVVLSACEGQSPPVLVGSLPSDGLLAHQDGLSGGGANASQEQQGGVKSEAASESDSMLLLGDSGGRR